MFCHLIIIFYTPQLLFKMVLFKFSDKYAEESWCQNIYGKYVKFFAAFLKKKCWLNVSVFHFSTRMPKMDALTYNVNPDELLQCIPEYDILSGSSLFAKINLSLQTVWFDD